MTDIIHPWPKNCRIYQTTNACNRYEVDREGTKVLSCAQYEMCIEMMATPSCLLYYIDEVPMKPLPSSDPETVPSTISKGIP